MKNFNISENWEKIEKKKKPKYLKKIIRLDGKEFIQRLKKKDNKYIRNLILRLYSGDFIILKNCVSEKYIDNLKLQLMKITKTKKSNYYKMLEGCPNFWRRQDERIAKKYSFQAVRDSFYFFRWNKERLKIWKNFDQIWGSIKFLGGLRYNSFVKNTPKDKVIDRVQIVRYPKDTGHTEPHFHDPVNQRIIISLYMSELNKDFHHGGTYFYEKKNKKINVEKNIKKGDVGLFYSTLLHGVDAVKIKAQIKLRKNNKEIQGRWWCGLYSPESNYYKKRNTSSPAI
jgi:hypothetical protein